MSARGSRLLAATAAISLALLPAIADARMGGGSSQGSRGGHTNTPPPSTRTAPEMARPMERTTTPRQDTRPGGMAPGQMAAPARSGGFMSGMMGGLIGVGLGSMLFGGGGGFFGHGLGLGGVFGFLIQMALLFFVGRFIWRRFFANRQPAMAGGPNILNRNPGQPSPQMPGMMPGGGGGGAAPPPAIGPADFQQFEQMLLAMQAAWSAHDLNALRGMSTPEMLSYFSDQLSDQASRGVVNTVTDVHLDSGDLSESWSENGRDYATVAMRFSMLDVTRDGSGRVVDGNPAQRTTATEIWTFVRSRGGHWILSAIQQTR